jgi:electron-transferring-flavoprotein dehydrogenase
VHHWHLKDGMKLHSMALENCIQCRTCEIVCPEVNLRVNPSYEGSGPDFYGL